MYKTSHRLTTISSIISDECCNYNDFHVISTVSGYRGDVFVLFFTKNKSMYQQWFKNA